VPLSDVAFRRHCADRACAAGLQAAGSTVGSKEPNILANYLRADPGFDEWARFYRRSGWFSD
jgi:hypothetical protein